MADENESRTELATLLTRYHDMERKLEDMGHKFEAHIQRTMETSKIKAERGDQERQQLLESQEELERQIEIITNQISEEGQKLSIKQEHARKLEKEAEMLKQNHQITTARIQQAKAERDAAKEKLRRKQADKENMRRRHIMESRNSETELAALIDITRLRISSPGVDRTKFEFTHVDERDLDKVYYVILDIAPDRVYSVSGCVPEVPTIQELVDQLNKYRDLPKFIKLIRNAFCNSAIS
ncbi:hypothetical protein DFQ28_004713 [Apophysomyces sp. BC1034]|nr:hypothetical protein DFQ30_004569 [Apophysomyces sp. BC1015]KAG0178283.1 hypothetical protein DFQ29_003691 [Apophysomyces sp. BC1021]KAG0188556.1 hypothetical protein DFQ28_004713 [Apophysomyces sp. BC1034]